MHRLYTLLFALSIALINPWGGSRGEIWTLPKVGVVLFLVVTNGILLWEASDRWRLSRVWRRGLLLWGLFLGLGLLSTVHSPFPWRSFWGQDEMGDGWLYWLLLAGFALSNALVLRVYPTLFQAQVQGVLIGGGVLALSVLPQALDWTLDYTATTGQLLQENVLASTVFDNHQPIGLYSHRGHGAFVLAVGLVLALLAGRWGWVSRWKMRLLLGVMGLALLLTQTRAAILALLLGLMVLSGRQLLQRYWQQWLSVGLVGVLVLGAVTMMRDTGGWSVLRQVSSDRVVLWQLAGQGIGQRPLLGWGFDGFGIAYPFVWRVGEPSQVVSLGEFSFVWRRRDGTVQTYPLKGNKSHNLLLDTTLSLGLLGLLGYGALFGFYVRQGLQSPRRQLLAVVVVYLGFGLFWFDCAQYSHLVWWVLSSTVAEKTEGMGLGAEGSDDMEQG